MLSRILLIPVTLGFAACSLAPIENRYPAAENTAAKEASDKVTWAKYCTGNIDSTDTPGVNYANPSVKAAAAKLSQVAPMSFYFYSGPLKAYGLNSAKSGPAPATANAPSGTTNQAHNFLSLLCGEFRDRGALVEEKINWVNNMNKLSAKSRTTPIDVKKPIWPQIVASDYKPYLDISEQLFNMKRDDAATQGNRYIALDNTESVQEPIDMPVDGQSICETKFIFSELVAKGINSIANYSLYKADYEKFAKNCSADDLSYNYVFRGDSNFKPNSPESNGMIWHSSSVAANCKTTTKANPDPKANNGTTDADCANYFRKPFANRWNAARSGLATWLLRDTKYDVQFSNQNSPVYVVSRQRPEESPLSYKFDQSADSYSDFMPGWDWKKSDLGIMSIASKQPNAKAFLYSRIRDGVNRHTNWYASGFFDDSVVERKMGPVQTKKYKDQAYSPFVASSYVMHASDEFTAPGVTVSSPSDGRKHWMFIFKVKKDNWYTPAALKNGVAVDFNRHWFDETSFGTDGLADKERAWDRLGTPVEGEYDSILYLHNITTGHEISQDDLPQQ